MRLRGIKWAFRRGIAVKGARSTLTLLGGHALRTDEKNRGALHCIMLHSRDTRVRPSATSLQGRATNSECLFLIYTLSLSLRGGSAINSTFLDSTQMKPVYRRTSVEFSSMVEGNHGAWYPRFSTTSYFPRSYR